MKSLRLLLCALPVVLTGCSTLSAVNWSAAYPWNWFGSSTEVTEQGVGNLTADTALEQSAIESALGGDYRLRSGMRTQNGTIIHYFEALKDDQLALVINGEKSTVGRIEVLDTEIETDKGVKIGTPFSDHISYQFSGIWNGPEGLMPSDDTLKSWKISKIIWQQ